MAARVYAIGDIHGRLDELRASHARIAADRARAGDVAAPVVHLGDLVDRGPDSRGVIAALVEGQAAREPWIALLGNHDRAFRRFLGVEALAGGSAGGSPGSSAAAWLGPTMGGRETLASYGVDTGAGRTTAAMRADALERVPAAHRQFLAELRPYWQCGDLLFVHAGIRPGIPLWQQSEDDLVWIRGEFHAATTPFEWLIIHGHTAIGEATHYGNRVNIDSGAGWGRHATAIVLEDRRVFVLDDEKRHALVAPGA